MCGRNLLHTYNPRTGTHIGDDRRDRFPEVDFEQLAEKLCAEQVVAKINALQIPYWNVSACVEDDGLPSVTLRDSVTNAKDRQAAEAKECVAWNRLANMLKEAGFRAESVATDRDAGTKIGLAKIIRKEHQPRKAFVILRVSNDYANSRAITLVEANPGSRREYLTFERPGDARAWIAEQESQVYRLEHNEASRPDYKVTNEGGPRFLRAYETTFGHAWRDI
jgi:hypothetical protein